MPISTCLLFQALIAASAGVAPAPAGQDQQAVMPNRSSIRRGTNVIGMAVMSYMHNNCGSVASLIAVKFQFSEVDCGIFFANCGQVDKELAR
jgi:hypothetical protein